MDASLVRPPMGENQLPPKPPARRVHLRQWHEASIDAGSGPSNRRRRAPASRPEPWRGQGTAEALESRSAAGGPPRRARRPTRREQMRPQWRTRDASTKKRSLLSQGGAQGATTVRMKFIRHPNDSWSGLLFIIALGLFADPYATKYGMGSAARMGPLATT